MATKNFDYSGTVPDVDSLTEGLEVVAETGLVTDRLVREAESKPALARLLTLDLLGPPDASQLVRAGNLGKVLADILPSLGEAQLASAADALLSISPEYRGQSYAQRRHTAQRIWKPDGYGESRYFSRPRKQIIRAVAAELARLQEEALTARRAQAAVSAQPMPSTARPTRGKRIRSYVALTAVLALVALGLSLYFATRPTHQSATGTAYATRIEHRYDGMDPTGKDHPGTTCADPSHPSQPVSQVHPSVIGPSGKVVGWVELRTSPICQVLWARVYWRGGKYKLPPGWTLHIQMHRRIHPKVVEFIPQDTSKYVYGNMIATVSGCAYAEVFFANGSRRTRPAITPCLKSY